MATPWIILVETDWSFWNVLVLLLVVTPLTVLWVVAIVDLFQRTGLGRWERGAWLLAIVAIPLFGALSCLLVRPGISESSTHSAPGDEGRRNAPRPAVTRAGQLYVLANLHDAGKLTDSEFSAAKGRVLRDEAGVSQK